AWDPLTMTATWTYNNALTDGSYTAKFTAASVTNSDGVKLDGNADGIPGDNYTYSFTISKPSLSLSGASNVLVGATYTLTLGVITDAGQIAPQYLIHWGDGTSSVYAASGPVTHVYPSGQVPTIAADVI